MRHESPFSFFVALDGPHLDGLMGGAGLLRYDWPRGTITTRHYPGISSAHNISLGPDGKLGLLGNFSQQVALVDLGDLRLVGRATTLGIEPTQNKLRSNTHHLWFDDGKSFLGAVGDHIYRFETADVGRAPEKIGPHGLRDAHEMRWDASRRWVLIGDLGGADRLSRAVSVFDLETGTARVIPTPGTVWHVTVHPSKPIGYAATYSFHILDGDLGNLAPAFTREYVFEIDLAEARIIRSWSASAEFPIHLNSDLSVYIDERGDEFLYLCSGGGHAVIEIPLAEFGPARVIDARPPLLTRLRSIKQGLLDIWEAGARAPLGVRTDLVIQTLEVTRNSVIDGVYACRVSPDGKYLVCGNRGFNWLALYDRVTKELVHSVSLPQKDGYHLGLHHSEIQPLADRGGTGMQD